MIGGFGNQMHLFVFTYLLSTLEKIPLYCIIYPPFSTILLDPKESAFGTFFNIHSFFPGQLHPIPQKEYNQMINKSYIEQCESLLCFFGQHLIRVAWNYATMRMIMA